MGRSVREASRRAMGTRSTLWTLALLLASGLWLGGRPRFGSSLWGIVEWGHVGLGFAALAVYGGYQVLHLREKWDALGRWSLVSGVAFAASVVVALASGVALVAALPDPPGLGWIGLHRAGSYLGAGLALAHTAHPLVAALRRRRHATVTVPRPSP